MVAQALGIAALLAGLLLLGLALALYFRQRRFLRRAREATGVVVALTQSPGEGGTLTHPVVEFRTAGGERTTSAPMCPPRPGRCWPGSTSAPRVHLLRRGTTPHFPLKKGFASRK